jgi:hypothetical protein
LCERTGTRIDNNGEGRAGYIKVGFMNRFKEERGKEGRERKQSGIWRVQTPREKDPERERQKSRTTYPIAELSFLATFLLTLCAPNRISNLKPSQLLVNPCMPASSAVPSILGGRVEETACPALTALL